MKYQIKLWNQGFSLVYNDCEEMTTSIEELLESLLADLRYPSEHTIRHCYSRQVANSPLASNPYSTYRVVFNNRPALYLTFTQVKEAL